eukprot:TRINITY_DN5901_c0_g2_i1.p1 TRINITY_DN5901_c0_g2~~TRINITY_DN5901_c0_g2_i1.p1  ORF type:complete len:451 (-),score=116.23 TRINITY_DN5901_c0_g2_i1:50-1402(-)
MVSAVATAPMAGLRLSAKKAGTRRERIPEQAPPHLEGVARGCEDTVKVKWAMSLQGETVEVVRSRKPAAKAAAGGGGGGAAAVGMLSPEPPLLQPSPRRPEGTSVWPRSQCGRAATNLYRWRPLHCRNDMMRIPKRDVDTQEEEQLLYLALYRDKIARHQLELEAAEAAARSAEAKERRRAAAAAAAAAPAASPGAKHARVSSAALPGFSAASPTVAAAAPAIAGDAELETDGVAASPSERGAGAASSSFVHASAGNKLVDSSRNEASAHIASVMAAPASGGVVSDHLDAKRLAKLWDEWRATEPEPEWESRWRTSSNLGTGIMAASVSGNSAGGGAGSSRGPARRDRAGGEASASATPRSRRSDAREESNAAAAAQNADDRDDSRSSADGDRDLRKMCVKRLYNVITNSKIRRERMEDGGSFEGARARPEPTHIEIFPTLSHRQRRQDG